MATSPFPVPEIESMLSCLLPLLLVVSPQSLPAQDETATTPDPIIELRISPLVDLWFEVRAKAEVEGELAADDPWAPAVAAARTAAEALDNPAAFGLIEGHLASCTTMAELQKAFNTLPPTFMLRLPGGGRKAVKLRELATGIADEIAKLEEKWMAEQWPQHEKELARATADFWKLLADGREAALLDHATGLLNMKYEGMSLPVYVVRHAPSPGGFTHRTREGAASFVACGELASAMIAEVVLHEVLHLLDVDPSNHKSLLNDLRRGLRRARAGQEDGTARHVVHTLYFLAAGEAVRSVLDPEGGYVEYGDAKGVYGRLGRAADAVRPAWKLFVAGELGAPEFVERAVAAFTRED